MEPTVPINAPLAPPSRFAAARAMFAHPFVLLLTGALLSNLLIPEWNHRAESHERQLTVKVDLSQRINEAVVGMTIAVQFSVMGARGQSPEDFDRAFMTWQVRQAVIASELETYTAGTALPREWGRLAHDVDEFYRGAGFHDPARRAEYLRTWAARRAALDARRVALQRALVATRLTPFR